MVLFTRPVDDNWLAFAPFYILKRKGDYPAASKLPTIISDREFDMESL